MQFESKTNINSGISQIEPACICGESCTIGCSHSCLGPCEGSCSGLCSVSCGAACHVGGVCNNFSG